MRYLLIIIAIFVNTKMFSQMSISQSYNKESDELEFFIENKDSIHELWIFDLYEGNLYSSTITVKHSSNAINFAESTVAFQGTKGIIKISPLQRKKFTFSWFSFLRNRDQRYFKISYNIVHRWILNEKAMELNSLEGELEFEIKEP